MAAEVFGIATAGVGLAAVALQLGDSALKLKSFCERVRDANGDLSDVSYELQTISLTLQELERHRQRDRHDDALLKRCALVCQEKADKIQTTVHKLEHHIEKFRVAGKLYATMKRSEVTDMLNDLERAKSSILLVLNTYKLDYYAARDARRDEDFKTQLEELRAENATAQKALLQELAVLTINSVPLQARIMESATDESLLAPGEIAHTSQEVVPLIESVVRGKPGRRRSPRLKESRLRVSFTAWFTGRIWEIAMARSEGGATWHLQAWNVVHEDAPIMRLCDRGDVSGVKRLLDEGKASTFDRTPYGSNPLDLAAFNGNVALCRLLLERSSYSARETVCRRAFHVYVLGPSEGYGFPDAAMFRLFIEDFDTDVDLDDGEIIWYLFNKPHRYGTACSRIILRNQPVPYQLRPFEWRMKQALSLPSSSGYFSPHSRKVSPAMFLLWAAENAVNRQIATFKDDDGCTALHFAAWVLAPFSIRGSSKETSDNLVDWKEFTLQLIRNGADPSYVWLRKTPLAYAMIELIQRRGPNRARPVLHFLESWISLIRQAGIDLVTYGFKENSLLPGLAALFGRRNQRHTLPIHFISGKEPANWNVRISTRSRIGIFELDRLPGAWKDSPNPSEAISWRPDTSEREEGNWTLRRAVLTRPSTLDIRHEALREVELSEDAQRMEKFLKGSQDDVGFIAMRARSAKVKLSGRRRCSSQPPPLHRRERAYTYRLGQPASRRWLNCHLCPFDNRWRFDCHTDHCRPELRYCMRGESTFVDSVQELWKHETPSINQSHRSRWDDDFA